MLLLILNVVFVLIAISMVALILMQRGAGAQAGSGFGGGASATVFGSRGSSNFLSKATKWLAVGFFVITLGMAYMATKSATPGPVQQDLGVMTQEVPAAPAPAPATGGARIPAAQDQQTVPSAPAVPAAQPQSQQPEPAQPVPQGG